jgi:hypothetical protein
VHAAQVLTESHLQPPAMNISLKKLRIATISRDQTSETVTRRSRTKISHVRCVYKGTVNSVPNSVPLAVVLKK